MTTNPYKVGAFGNLTGMPGNTGNRTVPEQAKPKIDIPVGQNTKLESKIGTPLSMGGYS